MTTSSIEVQFQQAVEHHQAGRLDSAETLYQEILRIDPGHAFARFLLGRVALQRGQPEQARDWVEQALTLDDSNAAFHNDLGLIYQALDRTDDAENEYQRALALRPQFYEAAYNLGVIRLGQRRFDEAIDLFMTAVSAKPDLAQAWSQLGAAYGRIGRIDDALKSCQKAVELQPGFVEAHHNLGNAWFDIGRSDLARESYERALTLQPNHRETLGNLVFTLLHLSDSTPVAILAAHTRYGELCEAGLRSSWPTHSNSRDPERRLRVGYVSPDFRAHSVAFFMEPVLANHDKTRTETYCYYNHGEQDETSTRLASLVDHWIPCGDLSDAELARRIGDDAIDVLVDLAGRTRGNRLMTFAHKPAPLQVTYLGYPATTGLTAMDYRLTTSEIDPEGSDMGYTERLYRLPTTLWSYRPADDAIKVEPQPPMVANGHVTFGSMNTLAKVSGETIAAWAEILRTLPRARLVVTNVPEGLAREHLHARFAAQGIDASRLDLHARLPRAAFSALMAQIDIALDPFPYNGTTTTCELLAMGIPVISVTGRIAVARSGHAILRSLGLPGLVGRDVRDYIRIAVELASDTARLTAVRRAIPARFLASPLREEALLARDLEQAYREMWRQWCMA